MGTLDQKMPDVKHAKLKPTTETVNNVLDISNETNVIQYFFFPLLFFFFLIDRFEFFFFFLQRLETEVSELTKEVKKKVSEYLGIFLC